MPRVTKRQFVMGAVLLGLDAFIWLYAHKVFPFASLILLTSLLAQRISHYYTDIKTYAEDEIYDVCSSKLFKLLKRNSAVSLLLMNAFLWLLSFMVNGVCLDAYLLGFLFSGLLTIAWIDLQVFEVPDSLQLYVLAIAVVHFCFNIGDWVSCLIGAVGLGLFTFLLCECSVMGGADVKLFASLGLLMGWAKATLVLGACCMIGSIVHIIMMIVLKKKRTFALCPYIALSAVLVSLWGSPFLQWYISSFMR